VKIEYTPTLDDVYDLKLALGRRLGRQPLLWVFVLAPLVIAAGATLMAVTGAWLWWGLALFATGLSGLTWAALRKIRVTRPQVEREYARRAWLRTPFRLEVTAEGVLYEHGPFRSRSAWGAFKGIAETESHLILLEKNGPAALAYGLAKRELERTETTRVWREYITAHMRRAAGVTP
jgi:uncharacterized protein (DUF58 family)